MEGGRGRGRVEPRGHRRRAGRRDGEAVESTRAKGAAEQSRSPHDVGGGATRAQHHRAGEESRPDRVKEGGPGAAGTGAAQAALARRESLRSRSHHPQRISEDERRGLPARRSHRRRGRGGVAETAETPSPPLPSPLPPRPSPDRSAAPDAARRPLAVRSPPLPPQRRAPRRPLAARRPPLGRGRPSRLPPPAFPRASPPPSRRRVRARLAPRPTHLGERLEQRRAVLFIKGAQHKLLEHLAREAAADRAEPTQHAVKGRAGLLVPNSQLERAHARDEHVHGRLRHGLLCGRSGDLRLGSALGGVRHLHLLGHRGATTRGDRSRGR